MNPQIPESFYRSLFANALDGLAYCKMIFDRAGKPIDFVYAETNKSFEKLTGLTDVAGKKATELNPEIIASNPELFEMYGRVSLSAKPERLETHIGPFSKWFLISVHSPEKGFFVAIFQDITERKQIEQNLEHAKIAARNVLEDLNFEKTRLETAQAKEEAILLSIGDGLLATDEKGTIILVNRMAEKLIGKKSKDLMGKDFSEAMHIEDEKGKPIPLEEYPIHMALMRGITTTTTVGPTYYYVRKDKERFPAAVVVTPVLLSKKVIGAIEVFRDITREKEIDNAKNEFISLASHQLRTPLSSIRWYSEMLLNGDVGILEGKQGEYMEEINHSNLRMIELVNAILSVSQIEMGTLEMKTENVDVEELLREVITDIESGPKKQDVQVSVKIRGVLADAVIDKRLLRMLIENLLVNAFKYTLKKSTVIVEVVEVKKGGVWNGHRASSASFGLSVADTGIGIPNLQKEHIFTKLFRADNARLIDTEGTGLGLYLAKRVTEYCKGEVWFISEEDKGSTFFILLPLAPSPTPTLHDTSFAPVADG